MLISTLNVMFCDNVPYFYHWPNIYLPNSILTLYSKRTMHPYALAQCCSDSVSVISV